MCYSIEKVTNEGVCGEDNVIPKGSTSIASDLSLVVHDDQRVLTRGKVGGNTWGESHNSRTHDRWDY